MRVSLLSSNSNSKSSLNLSLGSSLKADICTRLSLLQDACRKLLLLADSVSSSASIVSDRDTAPATAMLSIEIEDEDGTITIGSIDLGAFEATYGATAPAGTSVLYAVGRIAVDPFGNRLAELSGPRSFSLPVPESVVLPGTLPGDLKIAVWDGTRWAPVPSSTTTEPDGTFRVTATTNLLGAFAVLYAPGAGRIHGFSGVTSDGFHLALFAGGGVDVLEHAAALNGATGVWVQAADHTLQFLPVGGPRFVVEQFGDAFGGNLSPDTPVILVRWTAASPTSGSRANALSAALAFVRGSRALAPER